MLLSSETPLFSSEKLLTSAPDSALAALVALGELLVLQWPDKIDSALTSQYLSIVAFSSCHHSYTVRKAAKISMKKIVSGLGGLLLCLDLLSELRKLVNKQNWDKVRSDSIW